MARGRAHPVINLDVNPDASPAANPDETGGDGVASLFDFQGDARVRVLHRNEKTQRYEPHGYFPPEATEESILTEFGGGRFRVQLLVRDATGREIIKTTRDIDLPGQYKPPAGDLPGIGMRAAGATPPANNPPVVGTISAAPAGDDLMSILKAGIIDSLLGVLKASKNPAPSIDPAMVEILKAQSAQSAQMMQLMMTIITPLLTRDGGDTKKEMLETLSRMKELVAPPAGAPTNPMEMFNTMLETFSKMRDVAEEINPPKGGTNDPIMDSIPQLVGVIAEQHQMQKQRALGNVEGVRRVPGPAGGTAEMPVVGTIPQQPLAMWQQLLRAHSARLMAAAVAGHDPDPLVGTAIMFAPPNLKEALSIFFHREPNVVAADILTEIPSLVDHPDWLADFVDAAQERLFPEEFADEGATVAEETPNDSPGR